MDTREEIEEEPVWLSLWNARIFSLFLIFGGLAILIFLFGPLVKEELRYRFDQWGGFRYSLEADPQFPQPQIRPIDVYDRQFGIVIPKIRVNEAVFSEVDPQNPSEYLPILKMGVAHAKGSAYPDKQGNVYLFAHSADAFYNVGRYNAVFFLIGKLEKGDEVDIFYQDQRYQYEVIAKGVVEELGIKSYLDKTISKDDKNTVTLQTCYPPGTTLKRLLVVAKAID